MFTSKFFNKEKEAKNFFRGYGSFGEISGEIQRSAGSLYRETSEYKIECEYETDSCGVITRKDCFTNKSDKPIEVKCMKSRFVFEGGEYEVYTQFNHWQNESTGGWQPLITSVVVNGDSSRTTQNAAPFMVLWSQQAQRGVVFHLVPESAWEIKVIKVGHYCKYSKVVVEIGISDYNFDVLLAPNETINMPQIICYETRNKIHMDCYKLHNYMHNLYPRRHLPVIYNTWMGFFDNITYENLVEQIEPAANVGAEYFVIDAGWFGRGLNWSNSVGDWSENTQTALAGRMIDIANKVRKSGMKFGLWIEPERACPESDAVKLHPEFYIPGDVESEYCFLDFANEKARDWMLGVIFELIDKYGIEYIKDDYNANMYFDVYHSAFLKYHEGHKKFIRAIQKKYPDLYLSSCAAGGMRMDLSNYMKFDSSWPSDNESPYDEMRMYKNTILRLPPQGMERWVAIHSLQKFEGFYDNFSAYNKGQTERLVACADATWHNVVGVQPSFLEGYMTGGPIGLSSNLKLISDSELIHLKEFITSVKENREFWKTAVARIICDTPTVTVYQYSDMELSEIVIQLFIGKALQDRFYIYPELDENKFYCINDEVKLIGKEIVDDGIEVSTAYGIDNSNEMIQIKLKAMGNI